MQARSFLTSFLVTCGLLTVACGGSQSAATHPATPSASAPALPPVPKDPLDLMPSDAALMAQARIDVMKDRKAFTSLRRAAVRYACLRESDFDWLVAQTERAFVATRGDDELLVVLAGKFNEADEARALQMLSEHGAGGGKPKAATHGRWKLTETGGLAATALEGRLLVAGSGSFVRATLDTIDRPPAQRYADTEIYRVLGDHVGCVSRSVCGLVTRDGPAARRLQRELGGVGLNNVGRGLAESHTSVTLAVGDGMNLGVVALTASDDAANELTKQTKNWLWQAGLVARLAGFPDVLGEAEVNTEGKFSELKLRVGDDDLERVEQRLYKLLGSGRCDATSLRDDAGQPSALAAARAGSTRP